MSAVASVVIPAHDEEARIDATLRTLLTGVAAGELEVVVVCNGCTDATAAIARAAGVEVVEIVEASKIAALRAGDARSSAFPRIYLDADVGLPGPAALALAEALDTDEPRVAGVLPDIDLSRSSRGVRSFYRFRRRLPVFHEGIIGAGVYAMNASARARFGAWPDVLGDDQLVLRLFEPHERVTVADHRSQVEAPRDLAAVIRRGVRVRRGNAELTRGAGGPALTAPPAGLRSALRSCVLDPRLWPAALTWLTVSAWIRLLTRTRTGGADWTAAGRRRTRPTAAP